jgi:hypothetical protein
MPAKLLVQLEGHRLIVDQEATEILETLIRKNGVNGDATEGTSWLATVEGATLAAGLMIRHPHDLPQPCENRRSRDQEVEKFRDSSFASEEPPDDGYPIRFRGNRSGAQLLFNRRSED